MIKEYWSKFLVVEKEVDEVSTLAELSAHKIASIQAKLDDSEDTALGLKLVYLNE